MKAGFPPFYVGQNVIANCNHQQGVFKKGDQFVITGIEKGCCAWIVTVGIASRGVVGCDLCENIIGFRIEWLFRASRFSPTEEKFVSISLEKVLEKETELIGAN